MSNLAFLGIAVVLSAVGCFLLWLRSRPPRSFEAHIREFARELEALDPGSEGRDLHRGPLKRGRRSG